MEGEDPKKRLQGTYVEALKKNWMVWPAVQAVNFKFVPLEHRVLVVNVVSLGESSPFSIGWSCLCIRGRGERKGKERKGKERRGLLG